MIIVPGQNPLGNVMHVILGPESDLVSDIHGAIIMDITDVVNHMDKNNKVFLSVSKCRSESASAGMMKQAGLLHFSSVGPAADCKSCNNESCSLPKHEQPKASDLTVSLKSGKCSYCNHDTKLLPIPGVKVCITCAQIEFGRKHSKPGEMKDAKG